jgi:F-type H+-transporting ATPase subunit O
MYRKVNRQKRKSDPDEKSRVGRALSVPQRRPALSCKSCAVKVDSHLHSLYLAIACKMLSGRIAARAARVAAPRAPIAVRSYAAAASASSAASKPPVALFGLDGTYASALYTAAVKTESLDSTAKGLENLAATFKRDAALKAILDAPTLSKADKQQIVAEIQKSLGVQDKNNTIKNFLETLAENNRLNQLEGVAEKFGTLMGAARGEVELTVTSAAVRT